MPPTQKAILFAPEPYWRLSDGQRATVCNGCGSPGTWFVPDTIYGLRVTAACDIHDYMYFIGDGIEDKDAADRVFLNNLLRLIAAGTRWDWLRRLRALRARTYYAAVCAFGGPAFWHGKNLPEEMGAA